MSRFGWRPWVRRGSTLWALVWMLDTARWLLICFMQLADERGVGNGMWDVRTWEPAPEPTS